MDMERLREAVLRLESSLNHISLSERTSGRINEEKETLQTLLSCASAVLEAGEVPEGKQFFGDSDSLGNMNETNPQEVAFNDGFNSCRSIMLPIVAKLRMERDRAREQAQAYEKGIIEMWIKEGLMEDELEQLKFQLSEAQERVKQLEGYQKVHDSELGVCRKYCEDIKQLEAENRKLKETLENYAGLKTETGWGKAVELTQEITRLKSEIDKLSNQLSRRGGAVSVTKEQIVKVLVDIDREWTRKCFAIADNNVQDAQADAIMALLRKGEGCALADPLCEICPKRDNCKRKEEIDLAQHQIIKEKWGE